MWRDTKCLSGDSRWSKNLLNNHHFYTEKKLFKPKHLIDFGTNLVDSEIGWNGDTIFPNQQLKFVQEFPWDKKSDEKDLIWLLMRIDFSKHKEFLSNV